MGTGLGRAAGPDLADGRSRMAGPADRPGDEHPQRPVEPAAFARAGQRQSGLAAAVASIVAIAAQRARAAGDLGHLRSLIDRALEAADPQPDDTAAEDPTLPRIADADPQQEGQRLAALMCRQRG